MNVRNIAVGVLVLLLVAAGIWYWWSKKAAPAPPKAETPAARGTLPEINPISNPLGDKTPELNPVDKANPFKDIYKNPFK